jgi:probable lipoprotein NlpC
LDKITKIFSFYKFSPKFLIFIFLIVMSSCTSSKRMRNSAETRRNAKVEQVVNVARSYIGTPYKYGGSTKSGMDCSGLLQVSFQAAGLSIPRTSAEQAQFGTEVNIKTLKPGDLLFFTSDGRRIKKNKVGHVGMVTNVKSKGSILFIHSSTSAGVREDDLYSDYWKKLYIKARRPF